jgi:adenylylsulfate kinase
MTQPAFAVWITGLPSSGKSTITSALVHELQARGVDVAVLESDALRRVLTPKPTYSEDERDLFYNAMVHIGSLLTQHGVPVIFDATANQRRYRARARTQIPRFIEVYVECPVALCAARDVKGLYRGAASGKASTLPGVQVAYEPPDCAEVVVSGHSSTPVTAARAIIRALEHQQFLAPANVETETNHHGQGDQAGTGNPAHTPSVAAENPAYQPAFCEKTAAATHDGTPIGSPGPETSVVPARSAASLHDTL